VPLRTYLEWLKEVVATLVSSHPPPALFGRYAADGSPPDDPDPTSVLLDVGGLSDLFFTNGSVDGIQPDQPLDLENTSAEVMNGEFELVANGRRCRSMIYYDADRSRYRLESKDLDEQYYTAPGLGTAGLVEMLNSEQRFRVIPGSPRVIYTQGSFYRPCLQFGPEYNDHQMHLLKVLQPDPALAGIKSEKGIKGVRPKGVGWERDSLFDLVDSLANGRPPAEGESSLSRFFKGTQFLVCDDMGTELADFVLGQRDPAGRQRIAFIHCKVKSGSPSHVSAKHLQEVCSQAVKNLRELTSFSGSATERSRKWGGPWRGRFPGETRTEGIMVRSRLRRGVRTGREAWERVRDYVENPLTLSLQESPSALESLAFSATPA
jgi:hypothetical protein